MAEFRITAPKINIESKRFESNGLCEMFKQESCVTSLRLIKETIKTSDESWFDKEGAKETVVWCHVSETVECLFDVLCRF